MFASYAIAYAATAVVFFGIDFVWLSTISTSFYRNRIGSLLLDQPDLGVAGLFYLVYVAGIVHFAVIPAVHSANWTTALLNGALLGLVAYGTYDMTNLATLKNWSVSVSIVDMIWGIALTASAATCGYLFTALMVAKDG
ncbi:DUF2177 family protein [Aminobacter sp. MET-1]|uniref:DUF2177 family protein n=1 Tax=Aminobacter sp. MET-1 TaxID=2951085 RepID=UPI00226A717E|nr:DUF2177 family protein [Aminobacter sp. MET-1]MCX8570885.1 DUF2177 family protein [Aminobacter sp. MET-1]